MFRALRNSWRLLRLALSFARQDALFPLEILGIAPALIAWARERETFGKRLVEHQVVRQKIVRMIDAILPLQHWLIDLGRRVDAGESPVAEIALAIEMGANAEDLALTIHPHPTLSETAGLAAELGLGTITDLYAPRRRK